MVAQAVGGTELLARGEDSLGPLSSGCGLGRAALARRELLGTAEFPPTQTHCSGPAFQQGPQGCVRVCAFTSKKPWFRKPDAPGAGLGEGRRGEAQACPCGEVGLRREVQVRRGARRSCRTWEVQCPQVPHWDKGPPRVVWGPQRGSLRRAARAGVCKAAHLTQLCPRGSGTGRPIFGEASR